LGEFSPPPFAVSGQPNAEAEEPLSWFEVLARGQGTLGACAPTRGFPPSRPSWRLSASCDA